MKTMKVSDISMDADYNNERVNTIKKQISTLQWDLSMITNNELKKLKETELKLLQSELQGMMPN